MPSGQKAMLGLTGGIVATAMGVAGVLNLDQAAAFLREFGLPVCLVIGFFWFAYRVGSFFSPHLDALFQGHRDFLRAAIAMMKFLESHASRQTESLDRVANRQEKHGSILEEIHDRQNLCPLRKDSL